MGKPVHRVSNPWKRFTHVALLLLAGAGLWLGAARAADDEAWLDALKQAHQEERARAFNAIQRDIQLNDIKSGSPEYAKRIEQLKGTLAGIKARQDAEIEYARQYRAKAQAGQPAPEYTPKGLPKEGTREYQTLAEAIQRAQQAARAQPAPNVPPVVQRGTPENAALNDVLKRIRDQRVQEQRADAINQFQRDMLNQGLKPGDESYAKAERKLAGDVAQIGPGPAERANYYRPEPVVKMAQATGQPKPLTGSGSIKPPSTGDYPPPVMVDKPSNLLPPRGGGGGGGAAAVAEEPQVPHPTRATGPVEPVHGATTESKFVRPATGSGAAKVNPNTTITFEPGDFAYGPSAGGKLREMGDKRGAQLLNDVYDKIRVAPDEHPNEVTKRLIDKVGSSPDGKIRFDLTHMQDVEKILHGEAHMDKVTSTELRYVIEHWDRLKDKVVFYETKNGKFQEAVGFADRAQQIVKQSKVPTPTGQGTVTSSGSQVAPATQPSTGTRTGSQPQGTTAGTTGKGPQPTGRTTSGGINLDILDPPPGLNQPPAPGGRPSSTLNVPDSMITEGRVVPPPSSTGVRNIPASGGHGSPTLSGSMVTDGRVVPPPSTTGSRNVPGPGGRTSSTLNVPDSMVTEGRVVPPPSTTGGRNVPAPGTSGNFPDPSRSVSSEARGSRPVSTGTTYNPEMDKATGGLFQNQQQVDDYHAAVEKWKNTPAKGPAPQPPRGPSASSFWPQDERSIRVGERPVPTIEAKAGSTDVEALRTQQKTQLDQLTQEYDAKARRAAGRPDGTVDASNPEYQRIKNEYVNKVNETKNRFLGQDNRAADTQDTLNRYGKDQLEQTGSRPKNVRADIDLTAKSEKAAYQIAQEWRARGDNVTYDIEKGKYINHTTDTTLWKPATEARNQARLGDPDAFVTPGGKKGTGVKGPEAIRDPLGYALDNEQKFIHSTEKNDLKTGGKSVSKLADATGRNTDVTKQAEDLRNYNDAKEAGLTELGESDPVQKAKLDQWQKKADAENQLMKDKAARQSKLQQGIREEIATQVADSSKPVIGKDGKPLDGREVLGGKNTADAIRDRVNAVDTANTAAEARNIKARGQAGLDVPDARYATERPAGSPGGLEGRGVDLNNVTKPTGHAADITLPDGTTRRPASLLDGGKSSFAGPQTKPTFEDNVNAAGEQMFNAMGGGSLPANASGARQALNAAGGQVAKYAGYAGGAYMVYETLKQGKEYKDLYDKAMDSKTTDAEANQNFNKMEDIGKNMAVGGSVGAAMGSIPIVGQAVGVGIGSYAGTRYLLDNTKAGQALDRGVLNTMDTGMQAGEKFSDTVGGMMGNQTKAQRDAAEVKRLQDTYQAALDRGELLLKPGVTPEQLMAEIAKNPDARGRGNLVASYSSADTKKDVNFVDNLKKTLPAGGNESDVLRHLATDLQYGTDAEKLFARATLADIRNRVDQGEKYFAGGAPKPHEPDAIGDTATTLNSLYANANSKEREKIEELYTKMSRGGPESIKEEMEKLQQSINNRPNPSDGTSGSGRTPLTPEQKQQLAQQMTDDIINKALGITSDKPTKQDSAPLEPPPDPDADKKKNLQNYLNNMSNLGDGTQAKMDAIQKQINESYNSSDKRTLRGQLAALQQTKDDYNNRVNQTKADLTQLGVNVAPPGPPPPKVTYDDNGKPATAGGYTGNQLDNSNWQLSNQAGDVNADIRKLQAQIFASYNTPDKQDLMNQLNDKLGKLNNIQTDMNDNNNLLNALGKGGGASAYTGPGSSFSNMEPPSGDDKKIKFTQVSVLAGVMGNLDADRAGKATSDLANLNLQAKDVKTGWISQDAYNQIKNTLDAAGYQGRLTRAQAAQLLAQAQQQNSWGNTIGNSLVDSVTQGGTAFGGAVGGAAANGVNNVIKNAVDGKPKPSGGDGSGGSGPGGGGGSGPTSTGGGDSNPGSGGGGMPPSGGGGGEPPGGGGSGGGDQGIVGSTTNPDGTITVVYSCGNTWTGVPPAPVKCPKCGQGDQTSTTTNPGGGGPGPGGGGGGQTGGGNVTAMASCARCGATWPASQGTRCPKCSSVSVTKPPSGGGTGGTAPAKPTPAAPTAKPVDHYEHRRICNNCTDWDTINDKSPTSPGSWLRGCPKCGNRGVKAGGKNNYYVVTATFGGDWMTIHEGGFD